MRMIHNFFQLILSNASRHAVNDLPFCTENFEIKKPTEVDQSQTYDWIGFR